MDNPCVLALMAHPDDAEILCAGTLVRLQQEHGYEVHIATVANGDCGSATLPPREIERIRLDEGHAAAKIIGATYHTLALPDVKVCMTSQSITLAIDLCRKINPMLTITHPRDDYMMDHEEVHRIARAASFAFPIPNASTQPLPKNAHIPHLYYVDPIEGTDPYTGEQVRPSVTIDISGQIDTKAEMLACHASQREWLRSHHGMDEYLDAMRRHSAMRGEVIGTAYAEAFVQHRGHAYPSDDLLGKLLGDAASIS